MMSKKITRMLKGIGIGMLALTMVFGNMIVVNASEIPVGDGSGNTVVGSITGDESGNENAEVSITKELRIANGVTAPAREYQFVFSLKKVAETDISSENTAYDLIKQLTYETTDYTTIRTSTTGSIIEEVPVLDDSVIFPHAGEYIYEVVETATPVTPGLTYSTTKYEVRVYVKNRTVLPEGTFIYAVTVQEVDDDRKPVEGSTKVDPTPTEEGGGNDFRFINTYEKDTELTISKTVTGEYGDRTRKFNFPMTIKAASTVDTTTLQPYIGTVYDATNNPTGVTVSVTANNPTPTVIQLAHGESIKFDLPAGTVYTLTEDGTLGYKAQLSLVENDVPVASQTTTNVGDTLIAKGNGDPDETGLTPMILAGEGTNTATFTNAYTAPSVTGIIINNLPYIILIAVALIGFVLFLMGKRRRAIR